MRAENYDREEVKGKIEFTERKDTEERNTRQTEIQRRCRAIMSPRRSRELMRLALLYIKQTRMELTFCLMHKPKAGIQSMPV